MLIIKSTVEIFFGLGLFINALLFIPQIMQIIKAKSVAGISLITFLGFLLVQFVTVLHAIIEHDEILLYGYLLSMLTCGTVVVLIFHYQNTKL